MADMDWLRYGEEISVIAGGGITIYGAIRMGLTSVIADTVHVVMKDELAGFRDWMTKLDTKIEKVQDESVHVLRFQDAIEELHSADRELSARLERKHESRG